MDRQNSLFDHVDKSHIDLRCKPRSDGFVDTQPSSPETVTSAPLITQSSRNIAWLSFRIGYLKPVLIVFRKEHYREKQYQEFVCFSSCPDRVVRQHA